MASSRYFCAGKITLKVSFGGWLNRARLAWPFRWLRSFIFLSRSYHQLKVIDRTLEFKVNELQRLEQEMTSGLHSLKLGADEALQKLEQKTDEALVQLERDIGGRLEPLITLYQRANDKLPFCVDTGPTPWLARAEERLGSRVAELTNAAKEDLFYSYYSEIAGDQSVILYRHYEQYFRYLPGNIDLPVLDIGCGSGEFLDFLHNKHLACEGLDRDSEEVKRAQAKGHKVICGTAQQYLKLKDQQYSTITLFQVIEHMLWDEIKPLLKNIYAALADNGCCLIETINLQHPLALHCFFTDPTHRLPLSATLLSFLFEWVGFSDVRLIYLLPNKLPGIGMDEPGRIYENYAVVGYKRQN